MAEPGLRRVRSRLLRLPIVLIGLAGAGCTITTTPTGTGPTAITVRQPGTLPAPATVAPSQVAPGPPAPPPNGTFAGVAQLTSSPASGCRREVPIRNFVVSGDRVRFQGFRGTIQPDGSLEMQAGSAFVSGNFDGGRFVGSFWRPHPACTYDLVLDHVG
ncbi:MAG TPA: hypothetical protein VKI44_28045 [Acetobacteraceae bacterium]|nr:hypothetical protein [Acetobacteraceae bacterium]